MPLLRVIQNIAFLISVLHKWIHDVFWAHPDVLSEVELRNALSGKTLTLTQLLMDALSCTSSVLRTSPVTLPQALLTYRYHCLQTSLLYQLQDPIRKRRN